jgi:hypothetical protein
MRKLSEYGAILILLIPLFFINIKSTHDWGDDFAQYLHQAKNITQEKNLNETGYLFNKDYFIGPIAYPPGFPLLLAPIVNNFELDFKVLNYYMSLFWLLSCFFGFLILRARLSFFSSMAITLIIAYNPQMINFKTEVVSDYPFTCFSLIVLFLLNQKPSILLSILTGLLIGFLIHIRSIGIIMVPVFIIHQLLLLKKGEFTAKLIFQTSLLGILSAGIAATTILLMFPVNTNYPGLFEANNLWLNWNQQASYNTDKIFMFFRWFNLEAFFYIGVISGSALIVFSILGYLQELRKRKFSPILLFFTFYLLVIISYKYGNTGLRFMYPLLFIFFLFSAEALKKTLYSFQLYQAWLKYVFMVLILFSYSFEIKTIIKTTDTPYEGPCTPMAEEAFAYIRKEVPADAVIHFDKPRALALFTDRKSFVTNPHVEHYDLCKNLKTFGANYVLASTVLSDHKTYQTAAKLPDQFIPVFQNKEFTLYRVYLE